MNSEVIITAIVGLITTVGSGWTSWFFARKKYNAEVNNTVIENLQKSLDFYQDLADDNKERLEEILNKNKALENEILELKKQIAILTEQLNKTKKKK